MGLAKNLSSKSYLSIRLRWESVVKRLHCVHSLRPFSDSKIAEIDLVFGDEKVIAWYTTYYNYDKIEEIDLVCLHGISKVAKFAIEKHKTILI